MSEKKLSGKRLKELETCILYSDDPTFECNPSWDEVACLLWRHISKAEQERDECERAKANLAICRETADAAISELKDALEKEVQDTYNDFDRAESWRVELAKEVDRLRDESKRRFQHGEKCEDLLREVEHGLSTTLVASSDEAGRKRILKKIRTFLRSTG